MIGINTTFRAFQYRNYRLFFTGQIISLIGSWIENTAISWMVYRLTNSALIMGIIMFINAMPSLILAPFAGVIVDRVNKHKFMIYMQILFAIQALILAVLTMSDMIQIWHIIILGIILNTVSTVDMPLRQAFVINLVDDKRDLSNAISLNSSCFNLARLIGPAIAGALIAAFGEGICFLINSLSYLPVIWTLAVMNISFSYEQNRHESILNDLKDGFIYVRKTPQIRTLLIFLAIISFIGMTYPLLMPILAKDTLQGNAQTLGLLMSSAGLGALLSSLLLAAKKTTKNLPQMFYSGTFLFSICFILLGFSHSVVLSNILLFGVGLGMVTSLISSNTLIQWVVEDDKRGRVMSLHSIAFLGTVPVSNLLAGAIAQKIGISATFVLFGFIMLIIAIFFATKINKIKFININSSLKIQE